MLLGSAELVEQEQQQQRDPSGGLYGDVWGTRIKVHAVPLLVYTAIDPTAWLEPAYLVIGHFTSQHPSEISFFCQHK